jgi:serine/threonine protein kinase
VAIDWNASIVDKGNGTTGWHPEMYHSSFTSEQQVNEVILQKRSDSIMNTQEKVKAQKELKKLHTDKKTCNQLYREAVHHRTATRDVDVFSLGLIYLCMLCGYAMHGEQLMLYVKRKMEQCQQLNEAKRVQPHQCSPACILLYHPVSKCSSKKLYESMKEFHLCMERDYKWVQCQQCLLQKVKSGAIPTTLCDLLEEMTAIDPDKRPTIEVIVNKLNCISNNNML